jgi:hypothetical protein
MNEIIISSQASDPNQQQPFTAPSLTFLQAAYKEALFNTLLQQIGAAYSASTPYLIWGCARTGAADGGSGAGAITAGAIFYGGEIYTVPAASYTLASDYAVGTITVTNGTPDPIQLKNGTSVNVHNVRQLVFSAGASGSGTFDFASLQTVGKLKLNFVYTGSISVPSSVYADLSPSVQITTPNDGVTRSYMAFYSGYLTTDGNSTAATVDIRLTDGTTQFTRVVGGKESWTSINAAIDVAMPLSCVLINVAPNTTIKVQGKSGGGGGTLFESLLNLVEI